MYTYHTHCYIYKQGSGKDCSKEKQAQIRKKKRNNSQYIYKLEQKICTHTHIQCNATKDPYTDH